MRFRAGQVPGFADYTPGELVNGRVELSSLAGAPVEQLAGRLRALPGHERQALLAEHLRRCQPLVRDPRCRRAALLLEARAGALPIHQLAGSLGLHVRSLERLFVSHVGIAPKRLARILRLRLLLARMNQGDFASLAELAFDCGYSDQAHMTREFKELTGRLPGEPQPPRSRRLEGPDQTRVVHRYRP
ncbi:MAG: helix-turn-helix domain-containing protein [Myxococcales bacterium]